MQSIAFSVYEGDGQMTLRGDWFNPPITSLAGLLGAGWPVTIPGLTIDRKCGSGEVAVHVGAGLIAAGSAEVVVAGGAENMSRVRMGGNREIYGEAFGWLAAERYELTSQGEAAERVAEHWKLSRETLDAFAVRSHQKAAAAAETRGWAESRKVNEDTLAILKKNGMEVLPGSPQLRADMKKVGETILKEWLDKSGAEGKQVLDTYNR